MVGGLQQLFYRLAGIFGGDALECLLEVGGEVGGGVEPCLQRRCPIAVLAEAFPVVLQEELLALGKIGFRWAFLENCFTMSRTRWLRYSYLSGFV